MGRGFTRKRRHSFAPSTPLVQARQDTGSHLLTFDLGTCGSSSNGAGGFGDPFGSAVFIQDSSRPERLTAARGNQFLASDGFAGQFFLGADCPNRRSRNLDGCQTINFSISGGNTDVSMNTNAGITGAKQVTIKVDGAPAPLVCDAACAAGTSTPPGITSATPNAAINVFFCPQVAAKAPPPVSPSSVVSPPGQATDARSEVNPVPTATNVPTNDGSTIPITPQQDNGGTNVAAIAGGVTAAAVVLGLLLAIFLWRKRKRQADPRVFEVQAPAMTNTPQFTGGADLSTWVSTTSTVETDMTHKDPLEGTNMLKPLLTTDTNKTSNSLAAFIQDEKTRFANIVQSHSPTAGHRPNEGPST